MHIYRSPNTHYKLNYAETTEWRGQQHSVHSKRWRAQFDYNTTENARNVCKEYKYSCSRQSEPTPQCQKNNTTVSRQRQNGFRQNTFQFPSVKDSERKRTPLSVPVRLECNHFRLITSSSSFLVIVICLTSVYA